MSYIYSFLSLIMDKCYMICGNYLYAIVLFTFCTKVVLLPLSLWTYFNSITMVKIQPDINFLKVKYYGQKDQIAEEQSKLYKEKGYRPLLAAIPTFVQLFLLMGVVGVIKLGIANPEINMMFYSVNLGDVPAEVGLSLLWSPFLAGVAAFILCIAQNKSSVLQAEQSKLNKYGMTIFSVGLSLYLGWFVAVATAFYWICSNLMAVLQLYICNWIVKPRRYIDYDRLEESRRKLAEIQSVGNRNNDSFFSDIKRRERADYKRFFSIVNKHLVFYSEGKGFYKYFKGFIEYILEKTNITIHYITSDYEDPIFEMEKSNPQIKAYYIGENKLITLMMRMDADVVVMTMPDLQNYHIKRSYLRNDIEYIFVQHGMGSNNLAMRKGCMDHFDTIFCAGPHQKEEVEQTEIVYGLPKKKLVEVGYPLLDEMIIHYSDALVKDESSNLKKILIAPSWQDKNIVDSCLEEILSLLRGKGYKIVVRPHPQEVRLKKAYMAKLKQEFESDEIEIQTDFSSNSTVWESDLLITDWSGISWEYAFTKQAPVLFINTPMKVMNPEYHKIDTIPLNILLRDKVGRSLDLTELDKLPETVDYLLKHSHDYYISNGELLHQYIYNVGNSAEVGAMYIINRIQEHIKNKKELKNE